MSRPVAIESKKIAIIDDVTIPAHRRSQRSRAGSGQIQKPTVDEQVGPQIEELSTYSAPQVALPRTQSSASGPSEVKTARPLIPHIREASRLLVRELGFMSSTLAGTDLPPSAVHAIIEIGSSSMHAITASSLCQVLNLEKSSISRMVQKLVSRGLVVETKSGKDGREKHLKLTEKGMEVLVQINEFAEEQVESALECLSSAATALEGIRTYASALRAQRLGHEIALTLPKASGKDIDVIRGYRSGIVGRCLEMHMAYYSRTAGFGSFFEATVARGLGDLCVRLEEKGNDVWAAMDGEKIVGTIWVDGQDLGRDGKKAHLRAFIVSDEVRGGGVGRRLIEKAVEFVDEKEFQETHLWTFKGLEAARRLYVECGFEMVDEKVGKQWGKEVTEQHFVRKIGGLAASSDSDVKIS